MSSYSFSPLAMAFMPAMIQTITTFNPSAMVFMPTTSKSIKFNPAATTFTPNSSKNSSFNPAAMPFMPAASQGTSTGSARDSVFVPLSHKASSISPAVVTKTSMPLIDTSSAKSTKSLLSIAQEMNYLVFTGFAEPWGADFSVMCKIDPFIILERYERALDILVQAEIMSVPVVSTSAAGAEQLSRAEIDIIAGLASLFEQQKELTAMNGTTIHDQIDSSTMDLITTSAAAFEFDIEKPRVKLPSEGLLSLTATSPAIIASSAAIEAIFVKQLQLRRPSGRPIIKLPEVNEFHAESPKPAEQESNSMEVDEAPEMTISIKEEAPNPRSETESSIESYDSSILSDTTPTSIAPTITTAPTSEDEMSDDDIVVVRKKRASFKGTPCLTISRKRSGEHLNSMLTSEQLLKKFRESSGEYDHACEIEVGTQFNNSEATLDDYIEQDEDSDPSSGLEIQSDNFLTLTDYAAQNDQEFEDQPVLLSSQSAEIPTTEFHHVGFYEDLCKSPSNTPPETSFAILSCPVKPDLHDDMLDINMHRSLSNHVRLFRAHQHIDPVVLFGEFDEVFDMPTASQRETAARGNVDRAYTARGTWCTEDPRPATVDDFDRDYDPPTVTYINGIDGMKGQPVKEAIAAAINDAKRSRDMQIAVKQHEKMELYRKGLFRVGSPLKESTSVDDLEDDYSNIQLSNEEAVQTTSSIADLGTCYDDTTTPKGTETKTISSTEELIAEEVVSVNEKEGSSIACVAVVSLSENPVTKGQHKGVRESAAYSFSSIAIIQDEPFILPPQQKTNEVKSHKLKKDLFIQDQPMLVQLPSRPMIQPRSRLAAMAARQAQSQVSEPSI